MDSWWASFPGADSAPKPYDTSAVPPEFQTRPEAPQVILDIGTTTDGLNTTTNVLEKRILDIFKTVIDPPAIALLFHEVRRLRQLQVPARVRCAAWSASLRCQVGLSLTFKRGAR